mmetsp:Transcript_20252/g.29828  ORF Transcript_20252/g.29828 Transcript_20252/m.29828 type:complete len:245 (+) Transcript_20252:463-1197(+)
MFVGNTRVIFESHQIHTLRKRWFGVSPIFVKGQGLGILGLDVQPECHLTITAGIILEEIHEVVGNPPAAVLGGCYHVRDIQKRLLLVRENNILEFDRAEFGGSHCKRVQLGQKGRSTSYGSFGSNLGRGHSKGIPTGNTFGRRFFCHPFVVPQIGESDQILGKNRGWWFLLLQQGYWRRCLGNNNGSDTDPTRRRLVCGTALGCCISSSALLANGSAHAEGFHRRDPQQRYHLIGNHDIHHCDS